MDLVALPGIEGQHDIRPAATDHLRQLTAEGDVHLHLAIPVLEERHLLDAQRVGRRALLRAARGDEPLGRRVGIVAALVAAGRQDVLRAVAARDEARDGAGAEELGIVGMREDDHHPRAGVGFCWLD